MVAAKKSTEKIARRGAPARTPEARENQLVALAYDLAEKQLMDGTISTGVHTALIKAGSTRERLEKEKLSRENTMLKARIDELESAQKTEDFHREVLDSLRMYQGRDIEDDDYDDY